MAYYLYYHPLGSNGQGKTPTTPQNASYGALTFMEPSIPIYAMCEGTATVKTDNDGTTYCYISNKHANNEQTQTYFEYKYGDFSIQDGATVTKGQQIGTTSDKGSSGTQQIMINLTTGVDENAYIGDASNNIWEGQTEINSSINQSTALGWAMAGGKDEKTMAYNYLIFAGPLQIKMMGGAEGEWQLVQDWSTGIEGYKTLGGRTYTVFKQGKGPYATMSYWGGTICSAGCGTCAMACIMTGYGHNVTPADTAQARANGGWYATSNYLKQQGISNEMTGKVDKNRIIQHLSSGKPIILSVAGDYGPRSTDGHFICLLGYDSGTDKAFIGDSARADIESGMYSLDGIVKCIQQIFYITQD